MADLRTIVKIIHLLAGLEGTLAVPDGVEIRRVEIRLNGDERALVLAEHIDRDDEGWSIVIPIRAHAADGFVLGDFPRTKRGGSA